LPWSPIPDCHKIEWSAVVCGTSGGPVSSSQSIFFLFWRHNCHLRQWCVQQNQICKDSVCTWGSGPCPSDVSRTGITRVPSWSASYCRYLEKSPQHPVRGVKLHLNNNRPEIKTLNNIDEIALQYDLLSWQVIGSF